MSTVTIVTFEPTTKLLPVVIEGDLDDAFHYLADRYEFDFLLSGTFDRGVYDLEPHPSLNYLADFYIRSTPPNRGERIKVATLNRTNLKGR